MDFKNLSIVLQKVFSTLPEESHSKIRHYKWPSKNQPVLKNFEFCGIMVPGFEDNGEIKLIFDNLKGFLIGKFPGLIEDHINMLLVKLNITLFLSTVPQNVTSEGVDGNYHTSNYSTSSGFHDFNTSNHESHNENPQLLLIRFSDAEKLFGMTFTLLAAKTKLLPSLKPLLQYVEVQHECFSTETIIGKFYYELPSDSMRIECTQCQALFFPIDFSRHFHSFLDLTDNVKAHWGYDSKNWKKYISMVSGQDSQLAVAVKGILFADGNKSNLKGTQACPFWGYKENVFENNSEARTKPEDLKGFEPILIELFRTYQLSTIDIKKIKDAYDESLGAHIDYQEAEHKRLKEEQEYLLNCLQDASHQLSHLPPTATTT